MALSYEDFKKKQGAQTTKSSVLSYDEFKNRKGGTKIAEERKLLSNNAPSLGTKAAGLAFSIANSNTVPPASTTAAASTTSAKEPEKEGTWKNTKDAVKIAVAATGKGGTRAVTSGVTGLYNLGSIVGGAMGKGLLETLAVVTSSDTISDLGDMFWEDMRENRKKANEKVFTPVTNYLNKRAEIGEEVLLENVRVGGESKEEWANRAYKEVETKYAPQIQALEAENKNLEQMAQELNNAKPQTQEEVDAINLQVAEYNARLAAFQNSATQLDNEYQTAIENARPDALKISDLKDPQIWAYDIVPAVLENAPMMAMQIYGGQKFMKAGASLQYLPKLAQAVVGIGGATTFSLTQNAAIEAQSSYDAILAQTGSKTEAFNAFERTMRRNFKGNAIWEIGQMGAIFLPVEAVAKLHPALRVLVNAGRIAISGGAEALQERGEDAIQAQALSEKFNTDEFIKKISTPGLTKTDFISGMLGAFMAGGNMISESLQTRVTKSLRHSRTKR
jgi:hypothetical protein